MVLSVSLSRVSQPVYNVEVHNEHVYQVGELGVLVHNSCFDDAPKSVARQGHRILGELDELGRPTGIRATITQDMIGTGTDAAQRIRPSGFGGQASGHARGHLLGNQLGGSGTDQRHLVTLFQNPANHPAMIGVESQVRAAVEAGEIVDYWAIPIYRSSEVIPSGVTLRARGSGGFNLDLSIINRGN